MFANYTLHFGMQICISRCNVECMAYVLSVECCIEGVHSMFFLRKNIECTSS